MIKKHTLDSTRVDEALRLGLRYHSQLCTAIRNGAPANDAAELEIKAALDELNNSLFSLQNAVGRYCDIKEAISAGEDYKKSLADIEVESRTDDIGNSIERADDSLFHAKEAEKQGYRDISEYKLQDF